MQSRIPKSVAFTWVFKLYLTDHITPATGKTVAVTLWKFGGGASFGNPSVGASNATEIASGWYFFTSSTTDTNTVGPIIWLGTCAGCDNADQAYDVVSATNGGYTALPDTACTTNGSLITSGTGTAQLAVTSGKVNEVTLTDTVTTYTGNTPQTGDNFARIGATGSGLTSLAPSSTALSTVDWTTPRAVKLDDLDATVSSRLATSGYTVPPTAAAIGAVVAAGPVNSVNGAVGSVSGNINGSVNSVVNGVVLTSAGADNVVTEIGLNLRQAMSIVAASVAGVGGDTTGNWNGAGVNTLRINYTANSTDRSVVTLHPPA